MIKAFMMVGLGLFSGVFISGCKPTTPAQKVEDAAEDAVHETKQGMERAGENIKEAGEKIKN